MINNLIARLIALMPENIVWIFSKRYIAGKKLEEAVDVIRAYNKEGIATTVDVLGEYVKELNEAIAYKEQYLQSIASVTNEGLQTSVSIKPSMFGLLLDAEFCYRQMREVLTVAQNSGLSVCMDMEDSSCTQIELDLFERLYKDFPDTISIVIQAYLKRSLEDLRRLKNIMLPGHPINVRICKGIYIEEEAIAYKSYTAINKNYLACVNYLLDNKFFAAIATHDKNLVPVIEKVITDKNITSAYYEFQMLYGVRPRQAKKLRGRGHNVRIYVPYGTHWFGYSTRRLKENPRMISHIIKALIIPG